MRDIRNLLIVILCIAVISFGSYFMYKILDPVDNELIERDKIYLKLYIDEDGSITSEKNEYLALKIETPYEGAKLISYAKDDFSDQVNYVLYSLKGLNIYNVKTKKTDQILNEKEYVDGTYYLHLDNKGEEVLGYFFVSKDEKQEYYYSLKDYKKSLTDYKYADKAFVGNGYGDYVVLGKNMTSNTCGSKMYITKLGDNKEIVSGKSIITKQIGDRIFYEVRKECDSISFDIYDENAYLLLKDVDNISFSYATNGYYSIKDNKINKYTYDNTEISSTDYGEVLEIHDNFALLRDAKALYIMSFDDYEKVVVSELTESTENVSSTTPQTITGKHFKINHHDEIIITLRIRNISYSISKKKVV